MTEEDRRDLGHATAALEAMCDALPGVDPASIQDLIEGDQEAVEAARRADPLWQLYQNVAGSWDALLDAAEEPGPASPAIVAAAQALLRVAREGTSVAPWPEGRDVYVTTGSSAATLVGWTHEVGDGVNVDLDDEGHVMGVEVIGASQVTLDGTPWPRSNPLLPRTEAAEELTRVVTRRLEERTAALEMEHARVVALSDLLRRMARVARERARHAATTAREAIVVTRQLTDELGHLRLGLLAAVGSHTSAWSSIELLRQVVGRRDWLEDALAQEHARVGKLVSQLATTETARDELLVTVEQLDLKLADAQQEAGDAILRRDNLDHDRAMLWDKCERLDKLLEEARQEGSVAHAALQTQLSVTETLRSLVLRMLGRERSSQPTLTLTREVEEVLTNLRRYNQDSRHLRAELTDARQALLAALELGGEASAETPTSDLVGQLEADRDKLARQVTTLVRQLYDARDQARERQDETTVSSAPGEALRLPVNWRAQLANEVSETWLPAVTRLIELWLAGDGVDTGGSTSCGSCGERNGRHHGWCVTVKGASA